MTDLELVLALGKKFSSQIYSSYHRIQRYLSIYLKKKQNKLSIVNSNLEKNLTRRMNTAKSQSTKIFQKKL